MKDEDNTKLTMEEFRRVQAVLRANEIKEDWITLGLLPDDHEDGRPHRINIHTNDEES